VIKDLKKELRPWPPTAPFTEKASLHKTLHIIWNGPAPVLFKPCFKHINLLTTNHLQNSAANSYRCTCTANTPYITTAKFYWKRLQEQHNTKTYLHMHDSLFTTQAEARARQKAQELPYLLTHLLTQSLTCWPRPPEPRNRIRRAAAEHRRQNAPRSHASTCTADRQGTSATSKICIQEFRKNFKTPTGTTALQRLRVQRRTEYFQNPHHLAIIYIQVSSHNSSREKTYGKSR